MEGLEGLTAVANTRESIDVDANQLLLGRNGKLDIHDLEVAGGWGTAIAVIGWLVLKNLKK